MKKPRTNAEGLALVLATVSRSELARQLGLTRQNLSKGAWRKEVPLAYVVKVSEITGIPKNQISPETFG